ncbi:dystroglycan isoform X3 [Aricia agestis]|uniref:dystroglycan isoform X3 n=1 Tax=Aricia agestis TaxID=91739 RepID=UPI001C20B166|nr:dystroglycan isoform X3 [Aricia agestis]
MWARYVCAALLLPLALSRHDDDFAFDNNEEFQVELTANHSEIAKNGLTRLWGVPDTSAYVGHLFRMEIPKEAFSGDVIAYKVRTEDGRPMPSWLAVDTKHGLVSGIPLRRDIGSHTFTVVAHARTHGLTATDSFTIEVKKSEDKPQSKYGSCHRENRLVLAILIDAAFHRISPRQRIRALMELANFMALDGDEFWMEPYKAESTRAHTALMSGPGDVKRRRGPATTAIYLNVGCGEKLWPRHKVLVGGMREQARDGTIPQLLRLPVLGWRLLAVKPTPRPKRNSPVDVSSGDYDFSKGEGEEGDDDDYSGFGDEDYDEDDDYTGQIDVGAAPDMDHKVKITEYSETASEASNVNFSKEPPPVNPRLLEEEFRIATIPETAEVPTEPETDVNEIITSTDQSSTIVGRTTETVTFPMPVNQPPVLKNHMKKLAIKAGKAFRYIIPANLFWDPEEGGNLTYRMSEPDRAPLPPDSWVHFDPAHREVYGLPLESHVSRWNFIVEAQDSEGLVASGPLDIWVQQHEKIRTINHRFTLQFEPLKEYPHAIDWQIRALEGIVNLFRDTDMDHLTVLNATVVGDTYEFVWSNDTLPKDPECPVEDINRLMKIMESSEGSGLPSEALSRAMSPALAVRRVSARGVGNCARPDASPPNTYPPVSRNQVDHITAVAGKLLVHKVPEDTFYDPEDGDTRRLQLSLRFSDRSPLPPTHWLQFDARNQEFYGLPAAADEGSVHYQLIAEDSTKKSAYDSLIVEVAKAPTIRPTVEFQMTMDPSPNLINSAANKRKVVEKLAALFGQKDTDNIRIQSITDNPTTIIWYNTSLPMDRCPKREIEELRRMIIVDDRGAGGGNLREHVDQIFDKDLKVMSIRLIPLGLCAEQSTKTAKAPPPPTANVLNKAGSGEYSDYLLTFVIPAIVIVCMILVAGVIAAILYRRRRTGKMSVGDEEERQAFRSKGIPVIFQDELEERAEPEPADKSPVIMREEKPPLLPPAPDYRPDAPYRPPPPFAASRTPPRPKATPTYRKPPPYVPP